MIAFNDVSKLYTMGDTVVRALDCASFHIKKGEFVAIIGPSGSGKSTLMNIMGCLDAPTAGEYVLDGQRIDEYTQNELAKVRSQKIGFIFQGFNLLQKLTAYENVELPLIYQRIKTSKRRERVNAALKRVGLYERMDHKPMELSGGQQQRVAIARAIVTNPSILLADEPTGNLDSKMGAEIMDIFEELNENGNTIALITHDEGVAMRAKRRIHILDGRVSEEA